MAGTSNSITTHNVLSGVLNADNVISGLVNTAFNPAYALVTQAGAQIVLFINSSDYKMYAQLKDKSGNVIYTSNIIDLPLETMVVDGRYDSNTKKLILVLDNGNEIEVPLEALINGLVNEDDLIANYYDKDEIDALLDGYWTKIEITQEDIDNWNAKQEYLNQGDGIEISAETTLKGNTSQESTTGKNLLPPTNRTTAVNGVTTAVNSDGSVTISGTPSSNWFIIGADTNSVSIPAGTYTFSIQDTLPGSIRLDLTYSDSTTENIFTITSGTTSRTATTSKTITNIRVEVTNNASSFTLPMTLKLQLESGSSATSWEKFTGGNPAPNPDYPYPVNVVTGDNSITIANSDNTQSQTYPINLGSMELCKIGDYQDYIKKSTGKNLLDKNNVTTQVGYFNSTGDVVSGGSSSIITSYIEILPNTDYTISGISVERICTYDKNKNLVDRLSFSATSEKTFNSNAYYMRFQGPATDFNINNAMLNEGSTTLPYEPYGKVWYKYGAIGKTTYTGSEWFSSGTIINDTYSVFVADTNVDFNTTNSIKAMSNYFKSDTPDNVIDIGEIGICTRRGTSQGVYFRFPTSVASTPNDFQTWLSTHNTTVYYVLATPTITPITDTTLINQLDNLSIGLSNKWIKNISQTNADLPFEIEYDNTNLTISANLTDYYTKTETNTLLNDKVGFTDYGTTDTGGVIRDGTTSLGYEIVQTGANVGKLGARILSYTQYQNNLYTNGFIGKGTLNNVLDARIGDIQTLLDNLNTGSGV